MFFHCLAPVPPHHHRRPTRRDKPGPGVNAMEHTAHERHHPHDHYGHGAHPGLLPPTQTATTSRSGPTMCGMSTLAARLADTEALVLIRERTQIRMQLLHACPGPGRP